MNQTYLEVYGMLELIKTAGMVLQFEFKESFSLRIHNGKEITLLLWSVISFSESHLEEIFVTRRADHGPAMKWVCEVSP